MTKRFIADGYTGRTPETFCPFCFHRLDAATNLHSHRAPLPGDYTICIACCGVLRYIEDMTLQASSLEEIPMHSRLAFAKTVQACKEMPRPKLRNQ